MKKVALMMAAGVAMIAGSVAFSGPTGPTASSDVVVCAAPSSPTQQTAPASSQKAIRETRADSRVRLWRGVPAAIKNRGPGERAHRRWRKTRSAGRR